MTAHALRIAVTGVLLLASFAAEAQQTGKMHRIGFWSTARFGRGVRRASPR